MSKTKTVQMIALMFQNNLVGIKKNKSTITISFAVYDVNQIYV